jgi:hypothetical protein
MEVRKIKKNAEKTEKRNKIITKFKMQRKEKI